MPLGEKEITLTRRPNPTANGDWIFRRPGVHASIYVNRRIFLQGAVPDTITLSASADIFRLPGNLNSEATSKRIAALQHRAERKREIAESHLAEADALRGKADALHASLDRLGGDRLEAKVPTTAYGLRDLRN